jgi:hypothetical protein
MDNSEVIACVTDGITFTGVSDDLHIENSVLDSTLGVIVDLSTSTWTTIHIVNNQFRNPSGITGITVAASGGNLVATGIGFIVNNYFETIATATSGYTPGDVRWIIAGNPGVRDNTANATGSIEGSALTTTFAGTGVGNEVVANFGAAFVADEEVKFTVSTAGRYTYNGIIPTTVTMTASIFATIAGGAARKYHYYVAKNGTIIAASVAAHEYDGTNPGSNACQALVNLVTGDYLELYVRAETATTADGGNEKDVVGNCSRYLE